jgi:glycosyltransferase involved in cell wall biosynthesis
MKVLLPTLEYPPAQGGIARYLAALVGVLGDRVEVVTDGLLWSHGWPRWWPTLHLLVQQSQTYDIVLTSHVLPIGTAAWIAGWVTHKPYVVIVHGMDIGLAKQSWYKRWLACMVLRGATFVVANSKALAAEVTEAFGVRETVVAYPPVALSPQRLFLARTPSDVLRLLTVSRLVSRKGHLTVLEALAHIRTNHPELVFSYTIVGSGPMQQTIADRIAELHLSPYVEILCAVKDEDLAGIYTAHDVFVMPVVRDAVDREGFGIVYLEAGTFGLPSIATRMPGVDEAIQDSETGILTDGSSAEVAFAILKLAADPMYREKLGQAAQTRAREQFGADKTFESLQKRLS